MHKERFYLTIKEFKDNIDNRFAILLLQFKRKIFINFIIC